MHIQHESSVEKDITRIKEQLSEMARLTESSLKDILKAILENNTTLAYGIILRDQYIDEKEKAVDRLCLEFIVKQQPVSKSLRFAISAIKLNMEIERVGDYAENMARHFIKMDRYQQDKSTSYIIELAEHATSMFHDAIQSFVDQSEEIARLTIDREEKADDLRDICINTLLAESKDAPVPFPLLNIVRRFERVADQARNICMEVLYLCTGEYVKHPGADIIRILFVDDHNSVQSRIAEAVANGLNLPRFLFSSAGIDPKPVDERIVEFMKGKGYDISKNTSQALLWVPNLEYYQVIISFTREVKRVFPREPRKTIFLDWEIDPPPLSSDDLETVNAGYENIFNFVTKHIKNLVDAITGSSIE
jgi:phosphate transport system protein